MVLQADHVGGRIAGGVVGKVSDDAGSADVDEVQIIDFESHFQLPQFIGSGGPLPSRPLISVRREHP